MHGHKRTQWKGYDVYAGYEDLFHPLQVEVELELTGSEKSIENVIQSAFLEQHEDFLEQIRNPTLSCFAVEILQKCIFGDDGDLHRSQL
jgi:hypothetical protein